MTKSFQDQTGPDPARPGEERQATTPGSLGCLAACEKRKPDPGVLPSSDAPKKLRSSQDAPSAAARISPALDLCSASASPTLDGEGEFVNQVVKVHNCAAGPSKTTRWADVLPIDTFAQSKLCFLIPVTPEGVHMATSAISRSGQISVLPISSWLSVHSQQHSGFVCVLNLHALLCQTHCIVAANSLVKSYVYKDVGQEFTKAFLGEPGYTNLGEFTPSFLLWVTNLIFADCARLEEGVELRAEMVFGIEALVAALFEHSNPAIIGLSIGNVTPHWVVLFPLVGAGSPDLVAVFDPREIEEHNALTKKELLMYLSMAPPVAIVQLNVDARFGAVRAVKPLRGAAGHYHPHARHIFESEVMPTSHPEHPAPHTVPEM